MTLPVDLILVRHGASEANELQKLIKKNPNAAYPANFYARHDSQMRLTPEGVEQAKAAGDKLRELGFGSFDYSYVSPHARTLETAGNLRLNGKWGVDDRLRERDWGEYGIVNEATREQLWPHGKALKDQNEWYWKPTGGEGLATGVRLRFSSWMDSLHRKYLETAAAGQDPDTQTAIGVVHGELVRVARFVIERMTPGQWVEMNDDDAYKVHNTMILHYTRRNPFTGEVSSKMTHFRGICPWDESKSWNNGDWVEIPYRFFNDNELIEAAEAFPRLLGDANTELF